MDNCVPSVGPSEPHTEASMPSIAGDVPSTGVGDFMQSKKRKRGDEDDVVPALPIIKGSRTDAGPSARTRSRQHSVDPRTSATNTPAAPEKKAKSKALAKIDPAELHLNKPQPFGKPEVWAENRAAMCNTLPYFRSHQSSLYSHNGVAAGVMIDSKVGDHDVFSSQVIITTIGGGCARNEKTGEIIRIKSQDESTVGVRQLSAARKQRQAVVIIAGMGNRLWPSVPPHYYNVLNHFQVTDIWPVETTGLDGGSLIHWMVRFEKVDLIEKPWWAPEHSMNPDQHQVGEFVCPSYECKGCQCHSKEIYKAGWACLNYGCSELFKFIHYVGTNPLDLGYSEQFLRERTGFESTKPLPPLRPALPTAADDNAFGTSKVARGGIACPKCGRCSRRLSWERWYCENQDCKFEHEIPFHLMTPQDVEREQETFKGKSYVNEAVSYHHQKIEGYETELFYLPGEKDGELAGGIIIFRATKDICGKPMGPDELFKEIQQADIGLQRNSALHPGLRSEQVTSHFQSNYGAYYKFGVVVKTSRGFSEAPDAILKSLYRLMWAGKTAIDVMGMNRAVVEVLENPAIEATGKTPAVNTTVEIPEEKTLTAEEGSMPSDFIPFNEVLSLGYFESSEINYHDDGEKELGPTVATLSLGSPATMRFRPKKKTNIGPVVTKGNKKEFISFTLNHGDMVVMHGTNIHKYYEHEVKPGGQLRYALTCRHILLDRMNDEERRQESLIKGQIPEGSSIFAYDGENNDA